MTEAIDPRGKTTKYCWNQEGAVIKAKDAEGRNVDTKYTSEGNVESLASLASGTSNPYATTAYTYGSGQGTNKTPTKIKSPAGEETTIGGYPTTGQLFTQAQPDDIRDPNGTTTKLTYDDAARTNVTQIESRRGTGPVALQAKLFWDQNNKSRLASSEQGGKTTSYGYTGGNLTSVTPHNSQIIGVSDYVYDGLSRVTQSKDGRAAPWVQYTYDKLGRQLTTPDSDGKTTTITYDNSGNVLTRTAPGQSSSYVYDKLGRKTSETLAGSTTTYTYDKASNLETVTDSGGTTTYTYDDINRLIGVRSPTATTGTDITGYRYVDPDSPTGNATITAHLLGLDTGNGRIKQSIDTSGKLREVLVTNAGGTQTLKAAWSYTGDNDADSGTAAGPQGMISGSTLQNGGTAATVEGRIYGYTAANQVGSVAEVSGASTTATTTYTYDSSGNRLSRVRTPTSGSPATTTYAYNMVNQLCWQANVASANGCGTPPTGATSYTYDKAGNQLTGGATPTTTWDAKGRLATLGSAATTILSPNNNEITGLGSDIYRNNAVGLAQITTGGNAAKITRSISGGAVSQVAGGLKRWFITDQLGSTIGLADSNGAVTRTYAYDIDGNDTTSGTGPGTAIKFAGGHDVGGGLYHFGARYYQPSSARWTQMDPLLQPGDLGQANRYTYVGNNPINAIDPSGTSASDVWRFIKNLTFKAQLQIAAAGGRCVQAIARYLGGDIDALADLTENCTEYVVKGVRNRIGANRLPGEK